MIKFFRIIAIVEGISYLFLLFVSMPLRLAEITEVPTKIGGMTHGVLFIVYMLMILPVGIKLKWNFKTIFIVGLGSLIPFGTFYIDKKYLKNT
ncbi:MAG: integral membrane protein [Glaciecola sp.]|jgi:integral membrane protein